MLPLVAIAISSLENFEPLCQSKEEREREREGVRGGKGSDSQNVLGLSLLCHVHLFASA